MIPLKKFVQELLRRSRSTCSTLQTAICYIEATRNKIKIAQDNEQGGRSIRGDQVNNDGRIVIDETVVNNGCKCNPAQLPDNSKCSPCRKQKNILINFFFIQQSQSQDEPSTPLPDLPSALLCPRCAFMGALVLSAKFVQDKCYSNKAWAKLCGLPAWEVSRCERALGWRLWVGKNSSSPFAGLESKIGKAPTMLNLEAAIEDRDFVPNGRAAVNPNLGRSKSWTAGDSNVSGGLSSTCPPEVDFVDSPTPSLTYRFIDVILRFNGTVPNFSNPFIFVRYKQPLPGRHWQS